MSGSAVNDLDFTKLLIKKENTYTWSFWLEALIMMICPVPYWDYIVNMPCLNTSKKSFIPVYFLVSDFILVFMLIKILFLIRAVINYSVFLDIYSKALCRSYGFTANVRFAFKCFIRS